MEFKKEDIIIVTGASSGIGRALSLKLNEQGASVIGIGRSIERLEETKSFAYNKTCFYIEQKDLTKDVDLIRSIHSKRTVYYTVGEYIEHDILNVERYIDDIYKYYSGDMSEGLIGTLEKILNSRFHFIMKAHFNVPFETDFSSSKLDFFVEYYTMLCDLNSVDIDDYTSD